jgi:hypothetical protein
MMLILLLLSIYGVRLGFILDMKDRLYISSLNCDVTVTIIFDNCIWHLQIRSSSLASDIVTLDQRDLQESFFSVVSIIAALF